MLVRFQPAVNIFDEIETLFNSSVIPFQIKTEHRTGRFGGVSVKNSGEQVSVTAELPGVIKENVKLTVNERVLTISADRKQPELKADEQWIRNEIGYGTFERSIALPYSVDVDNISAAHENGILSIVLPKHENAKPKQISIR